MFSSSRFTLHAVYGTIIALPLHRFLDDRDWIAIPLS
jgi:hypothetical protein